MLKLLILIFTVSISSCDLAHAQTYIKGPALIEGFTETATAASSTTLTKDSQTNQIFTGAAVQDVQLPDATTLPIGRYFIISNRSTDILTIKDAGSNTLTTIPANAQKKFLTTNIGSANGVWDISASGGATDTPNKFAWFDTLGNLNDLNEWTVNTFGGANEYLNLTPADIGSNFLLLNNFTADISPTGNITDDYVLSYKNLNLSGLFDFNNFYGDYITVQANFTGTGNQMYGNNVNLYIAPTATVSDVTGHEIFGNLEGTITNGFRGFSVDPHFVTGSTVGYVTAYNSNITLDTTTNSINTFQGYVNGTGSINNYTGVQIQPGVPMTGYTGYGAYTNADATNFNGITVSPGGSGTNFTALNTNIVNGEKYDNVVIVNGGFGNNDNAALSYDGVLLNSNSNYVDYRGITVSPTSSGTNFSGINISPTGTYSGNSSGIDINMSNVINTSNPIGRQNALGLNGGALNAYYSTKTVSSIFVDSVNGIGPNITVDSGSPITGTTVFGNNFASVVQAQDDFAAGPLGTSIAAVAFVGAVAIDAGKTMGGFSGAVGGGQITGPGTLTDLTMFDAIGGIDGGAADVTNMYAFKFTNNLGLTPANMWGMYIDNANAENYLSKSLAIDTTTKKVSAANYGLEIGNGKDALVEGDVQIGDALKIEETGGADTVSITAPALAAAYSLVLPVDDGSPGEVLTTDGSGVLSWNVAGSTNASQALDNLVSTAINASLVPDTASAYDLGSATLQWANLYVPTIYAAADLSLNANAGNAELNLLGGGNFKFKGDGGGAAIFRFYDNDNSNFVGLKSPAAVGADVTFTLPDADGTAGQVLYTDGSGLMGFKTLDGIGTGGVQTITSSPALALTDRSKILLVDTTAVRSITLPTPTAGLTITIKDKSGQASTNNITVVRNASESIEGLAADYILNADWGVWTFVSDGTDWFIL